MGWQLNQLDHMQIIYNGLILISFTMVYNL